MSEEEFQELKEILMDHLGRKEPRQRLVEQDELRGYLEHSWIYKGENGGKPIVERIPGARERGKPVWILNLNGQTTWAPVPKDEKKVEDAYRKTLPHPYSFTYSLFLLCI
ncbi:hypothetical protein AKJ40_03800 [candidate division MSBL1 archaeon SCGC-AAA259M10]|uniref:Uncharacterized protein n=1 Tax=candidate division MSBL1 archaeon SCGC-AAA259M10 TaxID=1698270 RepID=A0A133UYA8_9EURY|nr:hypothetical protein AKJ40_03800 [candidate division MSBL1 archaeon SCGC-AAA259M10]